MQTVIDDPYREDEIEYIITIILEELYYKGLLKASEKELIYSLLGERCGLLGLLPRQLNQGSTEDGSD